MADFLHRYTSPSLGLYLQALAKVFPALFSAPMVEEALTDCVHQGGTNGMLIFAVFYAQGVYALLV